MQKTLWVIAILLVSGVALYWYSLSSPSSSFVMSPRDTIASWDMQASHKDGGALEKGVNEEIARLREHLADDKTEPPDYQLYVGLANQYSLLGDGRQAYDELQRALALDSDKTGLALHNMGVLMERLGAYESARDAYQRAVDVQPHIDAYHTALIRFLVSRFPGDDLAISSALDRAEAQFDEDTFVYQLKAQWLTDKKDFAGAIAAWEEILKSASPELVPSIESEIEKLRSKI